MNLARLSYVGFSLLMGGLWGVIGLMLAGQMLGPVVWAGVIASPAIGLLIALAFRRFPHRPPGVRIALALLSLYIAAGFFAIVVGLADAARPIANRNGGAVVIQTVLGVWWGITFAGYLPLLWPLAYLSHSLLGRFDGAVRAGVAD